MEDGKNILTIHSEWLRKNGFIKQADECLKQADELSNKRKKYEATKLHASSNRMGNAYRVSRFKRA
jgi:hypothetical protein